MKLNLLNSNLFRIILGTCLCLTEASVFLCAQNIDDVDTITITKTIDEVSVVSKRSTSLVNIQGTTLNVDMESLKDMPKLLGTSDPLRYLESLPNVLTNNETTTGIHLQGCDDYQTIVRADNAPIYYPNHLLGLFSTMIASHYQTMIVEQAAHSASAPNRIGGLVDFKSYNTIPEKWNIQGNVGLLSSDISAALPMGKKNALWLSARASYLNLYSKLISTDDFKLRYGFYDANLTYLSTPNDNDKIKVSAFFGHDNPKIIVGSTNINIPWNNLSGSIDWTHDFETSQLQTTAWFGGYSNHIDIQYDATNAKNEKSYIKSKASIGEIGFQSNYKHHFNEFISLNISATYIYHQCQTPLIEIENTAINYQAKQQDKSQAHELSLSADWEQHITEQWSYTIGLKANGYKYHDWLNGSLDPRASLQYQINDNHAIKLHYGLYHQYLHKIALINGGLPTDFFVLANKEALPEWEHCTELSYSASLLNGKYSLAAQTYFRQMYNVIESQSDILRLYRSGLDFNQDVIRGDGRNYGLGLMFSKNRGYVTGYISYSLGWARRRFPTLEGLDGYIYAANHERRHDLSVVVNSKIDKRWSVGAMFVLASGLPYTKVEELYILNGQIISKYGRHNAANLKPYHRLDLSVNCIVYNKDERELTLNLSLYNVYAHKNQQFAVFNSQLGMIEGTGMITIIPSISLYFKF